MEVISQATPQEHANTVDKVCPYTASRWDQSFVVGHLAKQCMNLIDIDDLDNPNPKKSQSSMPVMASPPVKVVKDSSDSDEDSDDSEDDKKNKKRKHHHHHHRHHHKRRDDESNNFNLDVSEEFRRVVRSIEVPFERPAREGAEVISKVS